MSRYDKRRLALRALIDGFGRGGISRVAATIGVDPSYVSRALYPETKKGFKRIGEDLLELLNVHFPGWLDTDHTAALPQRAPDISPPIKRTHGRPLVQQVSDLAEQMDDSDLLQIIGFMKGVKASRQEIPEPQPNRRAA